MAKDGHAAHTLPWPASCFLYLSHATSCCHPGYYMLAHSVWLAPVPSLRRRRLRWNAVVKDGANTPNSGSRAAFSLSSPQRARCPLVFHGAAPICRRPLMRARSGGAPRTADDHSAAFRWPSPQPPEGMRPCYAWIPWATLEALHQSAPHVSNGLAGCGVCRPRAPAFGAAMGNYLTVPTPARCVAPVLFEELHRFSYPEICAIAPNSAWEVRVAPPTPCL
jgi:hypothetical protein